MRRDSCLLVGADACSGVALASSEQHAHYGAPAFMPGLVVIGVVSGVRMAHGATSMFTRTALDLEQVG